jgi:alkylated DNA repair dioxygenase AlkB
LPNGANPMNRYYRDLIKDATAANASEQQINLIRALADVASESPKTRYGTNKDGRDMFVRRRLDSWLTAIQVGYKPDQHWREVLSEVTRSQLIQA